MISGIYSIRNLVTGKRYIGSAVNFEKRFKNHRSALSRGRHNPKLQNSWNKHGEAAFVFEVLEFVADRQMLLEAEQRWLDKFKAYGLKGYNVALVAGASMRGRKHTPEAIERTAAANRGRKRPAELVARIAELKRGTKHTEAAKLRMHLAHAGIPLSRSHSANISTSLKGRPHSEAHNQAVSAALKGRKPSALAIARAIEAHTGHRASAETRRKMSASQKQRYAALSK